MSKHTPEHCRCEENVSNGPHELGSHRCRFVGKVERDGKWYCKKHDPVAAKEKRERSCAEYSAKFDARLKAAERAEACVAALSGIDDPAAFVRAFDAMRTALQKMQKAYESVLPGIKHIAVQDYGLLNDAPCEARDALILAGKAKP